MMRLLRAARNDTSEGSSLVMTGNRDCFASLAKTRAEGLIDDDRDGHKLVTKGGIKKVTEKGVR